MGSWSSAGVDAGRGGSLGGAESGAVEGFAGDDARDVSAVAGADVSAAAGRAASAAVERLGSAGGGVVDGMRAFLIASAWAAAVYARARQRGCDHPHAVRVLARAWIRVLWRAWRDGRPYDPNTHTAAKALAQPQGG